jgi:lysozyme
MEAIVSAELGEWRESLLAGDHEETACAVAGSHQTSRRRDRCQIILGEEMMAITKLEDTPVDRGLNVVIDISHYNGSRINFTKVAEAGIIGVIHKATQGQAGVDNLYGSNKKKALDAGLLWGAYHFGTDSDGVLQAAHFLDTVGDTKDTLLALDFEHNPTGPSMSLTEARAFITHINEVTGRFPGFYSGNDIKDALGATVDPLLANCWFWLAQYSRTPVVPPTWPTWTFWQYTDGNFGHKPHDVPGVGPCDRDTFNGTEENLKKLWLTP